MLDLGSYIEQFEKVRRTLSKPYIFFELIGVCFADSSSHHRLQFYYCFRQWPDLSSMSVNCLSDILKSSLSWLPAKLKKRQLETQRAWNRERESAQVDQIKGEMNKKRTRELKGESSREPVERLTELNVKRENEAIPRHYHLYHETTLCLHRQWMNLHRKHVQNLWHPKPLSIQRRLAFYLSESLDAVGQSPLEGAQTPIVLLLR